MNPFYEKEIWTLANRTIKQHGDDAEIEAAMRSDKFLEDGDMDGHRLWLRITNAVIALQDQVPKGYVN